MKPRDHAMSNTVTEALKTTPPAASLGAWLMGVQLNDLVLLATLIYTVLLIIHKGATLWRESRAPCTSCLRRRSTDA